ncbi:MAG: hypothetical protein HY245_04035 [Rhizobiales bacterium]|nr:hypothetical protein [Hyphomicrobiales bacterium]
MQSIDRIFVAMALAWLVIGMVFGFWMGASGNTEKYVTAHVAMLLPGFTTFSVYGFIYRLWPALKQAGLARAQLWIAALAQLGMVAGSFQFIASGSIAIIAPASAAAIVAAVMMGWMFWKGSAEA